MRIIQQCNFNIFPIDVCSIALIFKHSTQKWGRYSVMFATYIKLVLLSQFIAECVLQPLRNPYTVEFTAGYTSRRVSVLNNACARACVYA